MVGYNNDNEKLTLDELWALQQRFNGPIPPQFLTDRPLERRVHRGSLSLYERQLDRILYDIAKCDDAIDELAGEERTDERDRNLQVQLELRARRIHDAAEALAQATQLRTILGMNAHPIAAVTRRANDMLAESADARQLRLAV